MGLSLKCHHFMSCPVLPCPIFVYPLPITKRNLGLWRTPRQEGKAGSDQRSGFQLGCETAWGQSHGKGDGTPIRGWEEDAPGR